MSFKHLRSLFVGGLQDLYVRADRDLEGPYQQGAWLRCLQARLFLGAQRGLDGGRQHAGVHGRGWCGL